MRTDTKLIRATYALGLVPLVVGLGIFFTWWIGKAWFLVTLHRLETYGFLWVFISFPLGIAGVITSIVFISRARKISKGLSGLSCILINIPVLIWIVDMQEKIDKRAYVRVVNETETRFMDLTIANSTSQGRYRSLDTGDRKTSYYYPNYLNGDLDSVPVVDTTTLVIETESGIKSIVLPDIYKGECFTIVIDKTFGIKIR